RRPCPPPRPRKQDKGADRRQGGAPRGEPDRRGGREPDLDDRPGQAEQEDRKPELEVGDAPSRHPDRSEAEWRDLIIFGRRMRRSLRYASLREAPGGVTG